MSTRKSQQPDELWLDLSGESAADRGLPVKAPDGQIYFTVPIAEWSTRHQGRVQAHLRAAGRFAELLETIESEDEEPSDEDWEVYFTHVWQVARVVLPDCPPNVLQQIPKGALETMMVSFFQRLSASRPDALMASPNGETRGSPTPWPGSSGPTRGSAAGRRR